MFQNLQNNHTSFKDAVSKMKKRLDKIHIPSWTMPFALVVIVFLSYGLKISRLGFYWDGWAFINILFRAGPDNFAKVLGGNRPLTALLYAITTRALKDYPLRWQIFGLICRWMSAVALWWALRELWRAIWPRRVYQVSWIAVLFVVYPGFTQQSISVVYSHIFFIFTVFIISLGAMVKANRENHWFWWLVSWLGSGFSMFALEYYMGLEIIRPFLLWLLIGRKKIPEKKRLLQTFVQWGPYLILIIGYVVWRFFFLTSSLYDVGFTDGMGSEPYEMLVSLLQTVISDLVEVFYLAWEQIIQGAFLILGQSETQNLYRGLVFSTGFLALFYFLNLRTEPTDELVKTGSNPGNQKDLILLGILFMVCAGVPVWVVPLNLDLSFPTNRFTLPMMIGASILMVGLIEFVTNSKIKKVFIVALMVGMAAGFHFRLSESYQNEWNQQKHFIWNLVWRIPYLEPGTVILADGLPFPYSDDEALTSLINLAYRSDRNEEDFPYGLFFISDALGSDELPALEEELPIWHQYGPLTFSGTTSQALVVYYSGDACLRVLNPMYDDSGQIFPGLLSEAIQLSDLSNILEVDDRIDTGNLIRYFGKEPAHLWCYYYQKAELARQYGQWKRIVKLGDLAFKPGYQYLAAEELFPFIEGYARMGDFETAAVLTDEALSNTRTLRPELCSIWGRVRADNILDGDSPMIISELSDELDCNSLK